MADKTTTGSLVQQDIPVKWHDNTDGTWALQVYTGAGGGGGGAATIADGADVAQGTTTDAASASTVVGLLKNLKAALAGTLTTNAAITAVPSTTATLANVASSGTAVTLIALNTARLGASVANDSTAILYIKYGSGASATSYNYVLAGTGGGVAPIWEMPANPRYTGIITGLWVTANGNARVNELTA